MKKSAKNIKKSLKIRVKNALKKREHIKAYRPSLPVAQSWFRTLNRGLFGSRLTEPHIHIGRLMGDWGRCCANWDNRKTRRGTYDQRVIPYGKASIDYSIELHSKFPSWKDFIETWHMKWYIFTKCRLWKILMLIITKISIVSNQDLRHTA